MNLLSIVHSARKLRTFLSLTFPGIGRLVVPIRRTVARAGARPGVQRTITRVQESRIGTAARDVFSKYYWEDHSRYTPDAISLPQTSIPLLRVVFPVAVALCVLLPLAVSLPVPGLPAGTIPGVEGPVALWSVALWLLTLAVAWGCLLTAGITTNRGLLLGVTALFLYFNGASAIAAGRSSWNLLPAAAILLAVWATERRLVARGNRATGALLTAAACALAGISAVALTPLTRLVGRHVITAGAACGASLGLLVHVAVRRFPGRGDGRETPAMRWFAAVTATLVLHQVSLVARAGWGTAATGALTQVSLFARHVWILLYFLGAGIVLKALGRSGDVVGFVRLFLRGRLMTWVVAVGLFGAAAAAWLPSVLETPLFPWPAWAVRAAEFTYLKTAGIIWNAPLVATGWLWLRWVLLFDVIAIVWLAVRRRLDDRAAGGLLFGTLVAWFLVSEYLLQLGGFSRPRYHSALVPGLYAIGILWTVHRTGLKLTANSTPAWPAFGRLGIYGGVLLMVLLTLHSRGATHDPTVLDEFFFHFFCGVAGFGVPLSLYNAAGRIAGRLPVPVPGLLGAFGIGAALTLATAAADRLVLAGGSLELLGASLRAAERLLATTGRFPDSPGSMPVAWILVRGLAVLSAFLVAGVVLGRRSAPETRGRATMILVVAAGLGFASFSGIEASLPLLPQRVMVLLTPVQRSLMLDTSLAATYLKWGLPALLLGLACDTGWRMPARVTCLLIALPLNWAIAWSWPGREAWVQSAGLLSTAGVALAGTFAALVSLIRNRLRQGAAAEDRAPLKEEQPASHYIAPRAARRLVFVLLSLLLAAAAVQARRNRTVDHTLGATGIQLPVPAVWKPELSAGGGLRLRRASYSPQQPLLAVESAAPDTSTPQARLEGFSRAAEAGLRGFTSHPSAFFEKYHPGAHGLDFEYVKVLADGTEIPMSGSRVSVSLADGRGLDLTLTGVFDDWNSMRWDLARVVQELNERSERAEARHAIRTLQ